jgi:hypothetical protein
MNKLATNQSLYFFTLFLVLLTTPLFYLIDSHLGLKSEAEVQRAIVNLDLPKETIVISEKSSYQMLFSSCGVQSYNHMVIVKKPNGVKQVLCFTRFGGAVTSKSL